MSNLAPFEHALPSDTETDTSTTDREPLIPLMRPLLRLAPMAALEGTVVKAFSWLELTGAAFAIMIVTHYYHINEWWAFAVWVGSIVLASQMRRILHVDKTPPVRVYIRRNKGNHRHG